MVYLKVTCGNAHRGAIAITPPKTVSAKDLSTLCGYGPEHNAYGVLKIVVDHTTMRDGVVVTVYYENPRQGTVLAVRGIALYPGMDLKVDINNDTFTLACLEQVKLPG